MLEQARRLSAEERRRLLEKLNRTISMPISGLSGAATSEPNTWPGPGRAVRPGLEADLDAIDAFATKVSAAWDGDMNAVEAIDEQRRDL